MQAKKNLILLLVLAVAISPAVAINGELQVNPSTYSHNLTAGDTVSQPITLEWTGNDDVTVFLDSTITPTNTSNSEGVTAETRQTSYHLNPNEQKGILLDIKTDEALLGDTFDITTKSRLIIPQDSGGGGTTIVYRNEEDVVNQSTYEELKNLTEDINETVEDKEQEIRDKEDELSEKEKKIQELEEKISSLNQTGNQTDPGTAPEDDFDLFVEDDRLDMMILAGILLTIFVASAFLYRRKYSTPENPLTDFFGEDVELEEGENDGE